MSYSFKNCDCEKCELRKIFLSPDGMEDLETACSQKIEKKYKKGDTIIEEGSEISEFIYLKEGLVKLYRKDNSSHDQIISISKPYDFVSLLSVFSGHKYNYSVTALEASTTCVFALNEVKDSAEANGRIGLNLIERVSKATDQIILTNLEIRKRHLKGRVAYILLYFTDYLYHTDNFELPVSRKEVAEWISMTPENVIRTLSEFNKDGIIKLDGKNVVLNDKKRLEKISNLG